MTVAQIREVLSGIDPIGELLSRVHFAYKCIIDALNTAIGRSFSDSHIFDVLSIEFLPGCIRAVIIQAFIPSLMLAAEVFF